ncbi:MAG: hypothetical protein IJV50_10820 [Lachnospiraceae bacterium]|nr:hypothetical protein [Lachnospiraceae bacterium]
MYASLTGFLHRNYRIGAVLIASFFLCMCNGCSNSRTAVDTATLFSTVDTKKYSIYDTSGQFTSGAVVSAYKISSEDLWIEYYVLPSVEQASKAFQNNKDTFRQAVPALSEPTAILKGMQETTATIPYYEDTVSGSNYERYALLTEDNYYVVSRIDTTLVYISTARKNLKAANRFLKSIGYY